MKINVNGVEREWGNTTISYSELQDVVHQHSLKLYGKFASPPGRHQSTVTWRNKSNVTADGTCWPSGTLTEGQSVSVADGMIFNVVTTSRA
jgi:hypothetical protein